MNWHLILISDPRYGQPGVGPFYATEATGSQVEGMVVQAQWQGVQHLWYVNGAWVPWHPAYGR
jgi:hypothetical protein